MKWHRQSVIAMVLMTPLIDPVAGDGPGRR